MEICTNVLMTGDWWQFAPTGAVAIMSNPVPYQENAIMASFLVHSRQHLRSTKMVKRCPGERAFNEHSFRKWLVMQRRAWIMQGWSVVGKRFLLAPRITYNPKTSSTGALLLPVPRWDKIPWRMRSIRGVQSKFVTRRLQCVHHWEEQKMSMAWAEG